MRIIFCATTALHIQLLLLYFLKVIRYTCDRRILCWPDEFCWQIFCQRWTTTATRWGGGLVPDRVREKWNILSNSAFSPCVVNKSQIYSIDTQRETQLHKFEIQWCIPHHPASGTHASQSDLGEKILRNCTSTCGIVVARRWCGVTGEHTVLPETTISHSIAITTYVYMHYVRVNIDNRAKEVYLTAASKALQITREFCIGSARLPSDAGASPKKR